MHYKNGREAKLGDRVVASGLGDVPIAGVITTISATATTCNGQVAPCGSPFLYVTLSDCLHVDDVFPVEQK